MWIDEEGNVVDEIPGGVRLGSSMPMRITVKQLDAIIKRLQELENRQMSLEASNAR